jgi:hypothetical protein
MKQKTAVSLIIFFAVVAVAGIGGWIANIVKLASMTFDPVTGMLVLRAIGVFLAPLGAILGYF